MTYVQANGDTWQAQATPGTLYELPATEFTGEVTDITVSVCNLIGGLSMTIDDVRIELKDGN